MLSHIQQEIRDIMSRYGQFFSDSTQTHKRDDLSGFSATVLFNLFSTGVSWTKQWYNTALQFLSLGTID